MTEDEKILRTQAWDYFAVTAGQRLTVINFYIASATLLAGGQLALLQSAQYSKAASPLGFLLAALSFIFWKWDKRSSDLIKLAEETLRYFEGQLTIDDDGPDSHLARFFTREHAFTTEKKASSKGYVHGYYTYRVCLNLLYLLFAAIGVSVALLCIVL